MAKRIHSIEQNRQHFLPLGVEGITEKHSLSDCDLTASMVADGLPVRVCTCVKIVHIHTLVNRVVREEHITAE